MSGRFHMSQDFFFIFKLLSLIHSKARYQIICSKYLKLAQTKDPPTYPAGPHTGVQEAPGSLCRPCDLSQWLTL